jgi:hypothetical protein
MVGIFFIVLFLIEFLWQKRRIWQNKWQISCSNYIGEIDTRRDPISAQFKIINLFRFQWKFRPQFFGIYIVTKDMFETGFKTTAKQSKNCFRIILRQTFRKTVKFDYNKHLTLNSYNNCFFITGCYCSK